MKVFPLLCGHQHMPLRYRNKVSASETVCELWFCVLSRNEFYFCIPKSHSFALFWHVWLPTDLDRKSLYILQTESQSMTGSMNSFFKNWKVTCCDMIISCHLVAQTEVVHSLVQRLWNSFSERSSLL